MAKTHTKTPHTWMTRSKSVVLAMMTLAITTSLVVTVARANTSPYRLVGRPIVLIEKYDNGDGTSYFGYMVFVRLNRAVPRVNGETLGDASLNGVYGDTGLAMDVERKHRAHPCYVESISDNLGPSPTLRRHHAGSQVTLSIQISGPPPTNRTVATITTKVRMQTDRHPGNEGYYTRLMGCVRV